MKLFVGAKIIKAEPMTHDMFMRDIKNSPAWDTFQTTPGYHVQYPNPEKVYDSWSPADVFEEAYRELNDGEIEWLSQKGN